MFDQALQIIAPHLCFGCGKIGTTLCPSCRYDIVSEPYSGCIMCGRPAASGICISHRSPISGAWVAGEREDVLARLINAFKFERCRSAYKDLSAVLSDVLPILPENIVITSVPTVRPHVRERGYDHAELVAKEIAKQRRLPYVKLLTRRTATMQRGVGRKERFAQAERAFGVRSSIVPDTILLIDDVITTGATLHFAAKALRDAGVKTIFVAALAIQPLDQTDKI